MVKPVSRVNLKFRMRQQDSEDTQNFENLLKYFSSFNTDEIVKRLNLEKVLGKGILRYWLELAKPIPLGCQSILKDLEDIKYDDDAKILHGKMKSFHELIEIKSKSIDELNNSFIADTAKFCASLSVALDEIQLPSSILLYFLRLFNGLFFSCTC
jgi:hypothetical protein